MTYGPADSISEWRGTALAGYAVIILTFGIVGVWATVAKLDKAVVAQAVVAVESNHKILQHFEGGIVSDIYVNDGDHVEQGMVLLRLRKVQAQASNDLIRHELESSQAIEARLIAERDHLDKISWPTEFDRRSGDPVLAKIMTDQTGQFKQRRESLDSQISILSSRIAQLNSVIDGIVIERDSTQRQLEYISSELTGLHKLLQLQLIPVARVYAMEREKERLEGIIGRSAAEIAKTQSSIGEVKIQIQQLRQKFEEDDATSLLEIRQKIADEAERLTVTQDILDRTELRAPRTGTIQNLKVFTVGQVLRQGETLLEIVPDNEPLVVDAHFSPADIDGVHVGQQAEIRFPAFHSRQIPVMMGVLKSISRDRIRDEQSGEFYFLGVISLDRANIPEEYRERILSGMSAEVIVASGERTVLSYFLSPLTGALRKGFIER
jgi:HlyD family secretion protein